MRSETAFRPKPMVEIGGHPILWHIMKSYARQGFRDFVVCLGYKGDVIRDYFLNYRFRIHDFTIDYGSNHTVVHDDLGDCDWKVTLAETGETTGTAGRLKRAGRYLGEGTFMVTYGDGLANVNLRALLDHHLNSGKLVTITGVHPPSRFGEVLSEGGLVDSFEEKPVDQRRWINGGFMVLERAALNMIGGDHSTLETILTKLAGARQLALYQHHGFWQCMDTIEEKRLLEEYWRAGDAPWMQPEDARSRATAAETQEIPLAAAGGGAPGRPPGMALEAEPSNGVPRPHLLTMKAGAQAANPAEL
jgi:glucose-1-phosphate cytidylyltransferase